MTSLAAQLPVLQIVVPLLTAPLVVLLRAPGLPWLAATAASLMGFAIAVALATATLGAPDVTYEVGGWPPPWGIELRIDAFGALMLLVVNGASSLALLSARRGIDAAVEAERQPYFYAAWLLVVAGLSGICATGDAFNIFVFMEVSSLASYVLVAAGPDRRALTAVMKYLLMGTIGATFYLIGVGLLYMLTGTLNLADLESRIGEVSDLRPVLAAAGFITVGLALKAAVFPLHVWLPNVYAHSPPVVTAFLAACSTKVALYVLLRFDFFVFQGNLPNHDLQFSGFLMPLAVAGMLVASIVALYERDLRKLLAYSSIAQVGYIVLGASFVTVAGLSAAIVHMFNHALAKGALFLALSALALRLRSFGLADLAGIGRRMPLTMAAFVLGALSLIGIPGTAGFISKWYLIEASLARGVAGLVPLVAIIASSLLAVAYVWRVVEVAYFRDPPPGAQDRCEAPAMALAAVWAAALANVWFGFSPGLPTTLAREGATGLLRHLL